MIMSSSEAIPENVLVVRDRLKHGQDVVRILESQVDTAQQNIVLLQGQLRLASETISNLNKHFQETENLLTELFEPGPPNRICEHVKDIPEGHTSSKLQDSSTEGNKGDSNKSPYVQQLCQVLDVLQDEEPRKTCGVRSISDDGNDYSSNCTSEHHKQEDYCISRQKINGHDISPNSSHGIHTTYPQSHCSGPCCSSADVPNFKVVEKNTQPVHYISVHSPVHIVEEHNENHPGQCGENCQCHGPANYVPYGYHVIESSPGVTESLRPISPSMRQKRPYVSHTADEEPPHLKYMKVKRIDESKLTVQKMLQDFTKRRYFVYNPRYDLDLLFVLPPIPASDLIKDNNYVAANMPLTPLNADVFILEEQDEGNNTNTERTEGINGVDILDTLVVNNNYTNGIDDQNTGGSDDGVNGLSTTSCNNSDNDFSDDNNNSINNTVSNINNNNSINTSYIHTLSKSPCSNAKLIPTIKEENMEGDKNLENDIAELPMRNDSMPHQECSYSLGMNQESTMSLITVGSNCT